MDEVDYSVMRLLVAQGRMTWAELAQRIKLSAPAAAERVRRLEERGLITGFGAILNRAALGAGLTAFIGVDLAGAAHRPAFLEIVSATPAVLECHHVTGEYDYLLKVACADPRDLDRLINEVLKQGPAVARTRTLVVLSSPKESLFAPDDPPAES